MRMSIICASLLISSAINQDIWQSSHPPVVVIIGIAIAIAIAGDFKDLLK